MENDKTICAIHTPCKNCSFAVYEEKTQTDCLLGLLEKFKSSEIEILEVYDEDKEFFVINNKKCVGYKEEKYFENRNLSQATIGEKADYVQSQLYIKYSIVINLKKYDPKELKKLAEKISDLTISPETLHIIRYKEDREKYSYKFIENIVSLSKVPKWKVKTLLNDDEHYIDALHQVIQENRKTQFFLSIDGEYDKISNIVEKAQETIYDKLSTFLVIATENGESIFFNTGVYRAGLNQGIDILTDKDKYTII